LTFSCKGSYLLKKNQQFIKESNLKTLFDLIYMQKEVSRSKLVELTELSPTTVSALVEELQQYSLVRTKGIGTSSTSGRKPIMLEVNKDAFQIVTVAWSRFGFSYFLVDLLCNEVESIYVPLAEQKDLEKVLDSLISSQSKFINRKKVLAICISIPAVIDSNNNIISTAIDIKDNEDILERINRKFPDIPVMIGNESAFYAYAEREFSSFKDVQNLIYININVGVGAGIIQSGVIYRGAHGMAGEIGHMSIDMNGSQCSCGNKGCLENLIKTPQIIDTLVESLKNGGKSIVEDLVGGDYSLIDIPVIARAFNDGDPLVNEIISEIVRMLSFGINNIISFYDPETVVIGGGIERLGSKFLEEIRAQTQISGFRKLVSNVSIVFTELSSTEYRNKGAAKYFIDNIFRVSGNRCGKIIIC